MGSSFCDITVTVTLQSCQEPTRCKRAYSILNLMIMLRQTAVAIKILQLDLQPVRGVFAVWYSWGQRRAIYNALGGARVLRTSARPRAAGAGAAVSRVTADRAAGLRQIDLHWHDLRHEGACQLLAEGVDIGTIQLMLGHADTKTTQRYLNITDEELRKAMTGVWERRRQLRLSRASSRPELIEERAVSR